MTSEEYGQYIDDFELGADVMPGESLTDYIERRRREFESKAEGGSIGIEVLFGPKREEYQTGGQAYDSRATAQDFASALKSVSAGTTYQQQADAQRYARNKANEMLTAAMRSGNQGNIQSILQGIGSTSLGGMQFGRSGNRITGVPATGPGRDKIINAMAQQMLNTTPYKPAPPTDPLGLLMSETIITDQMKSPAEMEAIRQKVLAAQKAQEQSYFMTDPVTGKKYSSEAEAIDDLGLVTYNQRFADGGRVGMVSGGFLKSIGKGIGSFFSKGDDAVDLAKQEEIFRSGPITKEFLETVDSKVINPFVRSRDAKGVGSYGLYDNFDDMPAGLKAAEIIKRFVNRKTGEIDYEAAEFFIGKKLKGDETINELIDIAINKPIGSGKSANLEELMADGGRVGLFMGGDPLTGQALQIYNSMKNYNFSDQEIADALSARGLYTPAGSGTGTTVSEGIINQQIQTGGGGDDKKTGFGKFGNLDPTTEKTFTKNVYTEIGPGKFDYVPTEVTGYKNVKTGLYQTKDERNINHLGLEIPTIAGALFDKNFGKGPQVGDIEGTFTKGIPAGMKNFFSNPFGIFKKQQATLKQIQDMNKKAVDELRAKQEAKRQAELQRRISSQVATGRSLSDIGRDMFTGPGQAFERRSDTFTGGKVRDVGGVPGGKYGSPRKDGGLMFANGGLATMFTRRR